MNKENNEIHQIVWQGISITVRHNPNWGHGYKEIQGFCMTHTEIIRDDRKQLPMTNTGYRSHFMDEREFEYYDDVIDFVIQWLDHDAQSKAWKVYVADQNQLKLVDFE